MTFTRLALAAAALALLAACDNSPKPPAQQAATPPAATTPAPAAPASNPQAAAAPNAATAPLMGTWSADPATCGSANIAITATRYEGAGRQCDIASLTDNGDGSFTAAMACTGAGAKAKESVTMRPLFAPSGEAIGLTWIDRNNEQSTIYRCGPAQ